MRAEVSVPVPMSWIPVVTSARPSASSRIVAWAGGPPPPHQICVAQPIPRSKPSGCGSRSESRARPAGELRGTVVAGEEPLARVGQPRALVALDVVAAAQLERVELERGRELVHRLLEHGHALGRRPVRGTRSARAGSSAPGTSSPGRSRRRRGKAQAPRRGRSSRPPPSRRRPRARSPASVPSRRPPSVTVWRVRARRPPTSWSSWRESASRTGRPVARASSAARSASMPAPCFPPKPPPMNSEITRTLLGARPNRGASSRRASNMPWVETHAVSPSPSQRATAACGSSGVCTWAGVSQVSSTRTSAAASAASGSPRTVSRGSSVKRCSSSPASRWSGARSSNSSARARRPPSASVRRVGGDGGDRLARPGRLGRKRRRRRPS